MGDAVHNFCDGVIIAAAFIADPKLGVATALAVAAHEIPQEAGDYIVLLNAGFSRRKALFFNALSGLAAVAGGVLGFYLVGPWESLLPYLLVVASSSFIYVAVADLLPQLQQRLNWRETVTQVAWLGAGLMLVLLAREIPACRACALSPIAESQAAAVGMRRGHTRRSADLLPCPCLPFASDNTYARELTGFYTPWKPAQVAAAAAAFLQ